MAKIIKINNLNKMYDAISGEPIKKYDPDNKNLKLQIRLEDGSDLVVDSSEIKIQYGGQIVFTYNNELYIVDDGYRDALIKAGYIVYDDYDTTRTEDIEAGKVLRAHIMEHIKASLDKTLDMNKVTICDTTANCIKVLYETDSYTFTIGFDTINSIVSKNQERTKNNLPFYPFEKSMDKYGTIYYSFFAEKKETAEDHQGNKKFAIADAFTANVMNYFNNEDNHYKFIPCKIQKRVLNWENL